MGQYFVLVNLDKKQFVDAHQIGNGLKMPEQTGWKYSTEQVAKLLLCDPSDDHPLVGAWRGDKRIGFVGDEGDSHPPIFGFPLHGDLAFSHLYDEVYEKGWTNISPQVREMMTAIFGITYAGQGWLRINEPSGESARPNFRPDMILSIP